MNGKNLKKKQLLELKEQLLQLNEKLGLSVVQVGNDEASKVYVRQKKNTAEQLGYTFYHIQLDEKISEK